MYIVNGQLTNEADNMKNTPALSIGLMSGTSMDGIDAALIETDGNFHIKELTHLSFSYPREVHFILKAAEYAVHKHSGNLKTLDQLPLNSYFLSYLTDRLALQMEESQLLLKEAELYLNATANCAFTIQGIELHSTQLHAQAVQKLLDCTNYPHEAIDVVGYHGQTLFHHPANHTSIQIGSGQLLANLTNISVVNDFRRQDVESGGQGAPFAPLFHQALAVRDNLFPLAVINCGGIANLSLIMGPSPSDVLGFDTGPGNGLIDLFVKQRTRSQELMDMDGRYGVKGNVQQIVLDQLYSHSILVEGMNYFDLPPPKSLDINEMRLIPELDTLSLQDGCATLEAFTADSIVHGLCQISPPKFLQIVLAGGGWNNPIILKELKSRVHKHLGLETVIKTADQIGWKSQALEAQIFAYLAVRSQRKLPISYPNITRVPKPLTGGTLSLPNKISEMYL